MQISSKIKKQILDTIFKCLNPDDTTIILFGSQAEKHSPSRSDIDIGLFSKHKIDDYIFLLIDEELNAKVDTLQKIDLVDFSTINKNFKDIALMNYKKWHTAKNLKDTLKI